MDKKEILDFIIENDYDGDHNKQWLIDQIVRKLTGDNYSNWVKEYNNGEYGPNTYEWDAGIAP